LNGHNLADGCDRVGNALGHRCDGAAARRAVERCGLPARLITLGNAGEGIFLTGGAVQNAAR